MKARYLWCDLETTGLDEHADAILECAVIVTDVDLIPIRADSWVIGMTDLARARLAENEKVRDMHTRNGLIAECERSSGTVGELDRDLERLISAFEWDEANDGKPILAGSTIGFDHKFLAIDCPVASALLHYRSLDVTPIKLMIVDVLGGRFAKAEKHRAMDDVSESLLQARCIASAMGAIAEDARAMATLGCAGLGPEPTPG